MPNETPEPLPGPGDDQSRQGENRRGANQPQNSKPQEKRVGRVRMQNCTAHVDGLYGALGFKNRGRERLPLHNVRHGGWKPCLAGRAKLVQWSGDRWRGRRGRLAHGIFLGLRTAPRREDQDATKNTKLKNED